jgi:hypothetical protein
LFGIGDYELEILYYWHQSLDLRRQVRRSAEITPYPAFQAGSLANVDDIAFFVLEQIYPGPGRQGS